MRKLFFFAVCLVPIFCFNQNKYFKGAVLSESDSLPLAYVNVYNNVYKFGTVTNELGEYILNYPDSINNFKIHYSSLGFSTKTLDLASIKDTIFLEVSNIKLDEVIIGNKDISIVLDKVFKNIKKNYANKRHLLKAFYRQIAIQTEDSSYTRIVEADVGIQEYGILKKLDRDRIKIYEYRKSDDKITKKWYMSVAEKMFGKRNNLVWIKKKDFIKNFVKNNNHRSHYKNILKNFRFEFADYTSIDNDLVAIYNFYDKKLGQKNIQEAHKSKIYINLNDYAIMKVIYMSLVGNEKSYNIIGMPDAYYYTKISDYYYLSNVINSQYLSGKGKNKELLIDQLYVYQVYQKRKDYEKIKRKEKEKITGDVYDKNIKLDSSFWSNYEILPLIPLKDKLKTVLEKSKSLEKQFTENDKKQ